ncbi:hypothetical protein Tco_1494068, partial [Tanacetum coccineum]
DKELISNVVGYATGAAAHKEFSTCLACCKKTCDNTQLAYECPGKHHSRPASTRLKWCPIPIQPLTGSYQLSYCSRNNVHRYYSSKKIVLRVIIRGRTVNGIERQRLGHGKCTIKALANGLKPALQIELLRARPTTLVEAFSLSRTTEARFEDERTTTTIVNPNDLNIAILDQVLEESILHTSDKVEITSDNDARDQASEVEMKVLVDGKQDDTKVVKVVVWPLSKTMTK